MTNQMIPAEAVEAAWDKLHENPTRPISIAYRELEAALEAAAPHMLAPLLVLAAERDNALGTIRGHITTYELRTILGTNKQGEKS